MFEPLPDDIADALATAALRLGGYGDVRYQSEIGSTNDTALALAVSGVSEGTSVVADLQTRGRGRRGRDWFSPPGSGLYVSVVVRPELAADVIPVLTLAAGIAVADAVRTLSALPVELKWPNDIVIGRPWRKLGGVLCEAASTGGRMDAVVMGIGINLRSVNYPPDVAMRATSIETELGRAVDRGSLLVVLLERLQQVLARVRTAGREAICQDWRIYGQPGLAGATVHWEDRDGTRRGRAMDIAADGALLVDVGGQVHRVIAGDVIWESGRE